MISFKVYFLKGDSQAISNPTYKVFCSIYGVIKAEHAIKYGQYDLVSFSLLNRLLLS